MEQGKIFNGSPIQIQYTAQATGTQLKCRVVSRPGNLNLYGGDSITFTESCVATRNATKRLAERTTLAPRDLRIAQIPTNKAIVIEMATA